jgi:hypothetical protein
MNSQLPEDIWSPSDLTELIADLHRYAEWLSSYSVKQRVAGQAVTMTPPPLSARAVASLQQLQEKQALTVAGVEALITDLQQFQSRARVVTFTLAGPPSHGLQKRVVAWCRQTLSPDVLVSFQFNATILGGVVVRYGSHIFDWSYRRQILANRGKFAEILRSV